MNTQLILYPQNYQGYNDLSLPVFNQYIVNGINFVGLGSTTLHNTTAANPADDAIATSPPSIPNTWYRYTTTGGSWQTIPPPIVSSNKAILYSNASGAGHSGIYQKLSSLTVGVDYDITINLNAASAGGIGLFRIYSGTIMHTNIIFSTNATQIIKTFTANSANDIFLLDYSSLVNAIQIDSISITESEQTPTGTITDLVDGQVICDLYQEEDIPLTLSVDDFKNVAEKVQSYSKDFSLPATKRNNKIFDSLFDVTRSDTGFNFNPYVKTKSVLKQNGYVLFDGYLRLIDIKDNEGEISYNVNLYSEVIALADTLQNRTFANIDFSELDHAYQKTNIKNSWVNTTGITLTFPLASTDSFAYSPAIGNLTNTNVLKYPFVDWTGQIMISNGSTGTNATHSYPELLNLEQAFRPFIKIKYLIDRIFADTNFTYTSDFFDSANFDTLFMDFNWGGNEIPLPTAEYAATYAYSAVSATGSFTEFRLLPETATGGQSGSTLPPNYNTSTYVITATTDNEIYEITYSFTLSNQDMSGPNSVATRWLHNTTIVQGSNNTTTIGPNGLLLFTGSFIAILNTGDTLKAQFNANTSDIKQINNPINTCVFVVSNTSVTTQIINALRGDIGQWEFLKGIFTMFNLISMPDPDNPLNILIEPYADIFINNTAGRSLAARGIQHDWTDKVDVSQMELKPLTDLNINTVFKYAEDDDDFAFNLYKQSTSGFLYGSKVYDATAFSILDGREEIVADPFAATVVKPLFSQFPNFITPAIFSADDDGNTEGFDNAPRIVHINTKKQLDTPLTYYIPAQNGLTSENQDYFLQCSHLSAIPTVTSSPPVASDTTDINFGECQLFTPLQGVLTNLFNTYWLPYYNELYNPDTKTMTMKVSLTPADINTFKFNDKVMIKNRVFRVNRIDYKPNDLATVEFILIP